MPCIKAREIEEMPNTYAHYRFGQEILRSLPAEKQHLLRKNLPLYLIGQHGPDILFYYHPLQTNRINSIGYSMHEWTGKQFFTRGAEIVRNSRNPEASYAYLVGFLCHYALDSTCHPYVEEKIKKSCHSSGNESGENARSSGIKEEFPKSRVYHTEIEGAFDRMLLIRDGFDPVMHSLVDHIYPTNGRARIIAPFFDPAGPKEVYTALKSMHYFGRFITTDSDPRRFLIFLTLALSGNYPEVHGMIITKKPDPRMKDSNKELMRLYKKAKLEFPSMLAELDGVLAGTGTFSSRFDHTFSWF